MSYTEFHIPSDVFPVSILHGEPILDEDGTRLYENDESGLRYKIIKLNDVPTLKKYISAEGVWTIAPTDTIDDDPFWNAAAHGSTDVLRVLLELYDANPKTFAIPTLEERRISLLNTACAHARVETVRFLLDRQPPIGTIHDRDLWGKTALISAAMSLGCSIPDRSDTESPDDWLHDRVNRAEELIYFLLERGASAQDAEFPPQPPQDTGQPPHELGAATVTWTSYVLSCGVTGEDPQQPLSTVLGEAVSRGSYALIKRLLGEGADTFAKQRYIGDIGNLRRGKDSSLDVTPFHLGSLFWNAEGLQALLDHGSSGDSDNIAECDIKDLITSRDSSGRLPLHWAAAGPRNECMLLDDDVSSRIEKIFKLLLANHPDTINVQDEEGATPLHYALASHAGCGRSKHSELAIRLLLENGADARVHDKGGHTVLHIMTFCCDDEPIDTTLLDLLITHGVDVNHVDKDGDTPLHYMAANLRQVQAAKFLLSRGADIHATDAKGNTAFHRLMRSGGLQPRRNRDGKFERPTVADQIQAQDEMLDVLLEAAGDDSMMDQPNTAGRTPRQLRSEIRDRWQGRGLTTRGRRPPRARG